MPRHATDTRAIEVGLLCLDAAQAAQLLVALLLPLGNERRVGIIVLEQPVVQRLADSLTFVVEVVYVPRACNTADACQRGRAVVRAATTGSTVDGRRSGTYADA